MFWLPVWRSLPQTVVWLVVFAAAAEAANPVDRPVRRNIFVNQVGYLPGGAKYCVVEDSAGTLVKEFSVWEVDTISSKSRSFSGKLRPVAGDFGTYYVGDFSELKKPGKYCVWVRCQCPRWHHKTPMFGSHTFRIAEDVYSDPISKGIGHYTAQRCGDSKTGYNAPCHLDDGRTSDGKHVDLAGGWHCSSDVNKWMSIELLGMQGLLNVARLSEHEQLRSRIHEEVKWGNLYLLKMQSPDGYIYSHGIGGDNRSRPTWALYFTDNKIGTKDDRLATLGVGSMYTQHVWIAAEAMLATLLKKQDPAYARKCLEAARRCFSWTKERKSQGYLHVGSGISAGVLMHRATGDEQYKAYAVKMADEFIKLQAKQYVGSQQEVRGHFGGVELMRSQTVPLIALCELAEAFSDSDDKQASAWKQAIELHCSSCLAVFASRNAFGIAPYVVGSGGAEDRKIGQLKYRNFPDPAKHQAGGEGTSNRLPRIGVALVKAGRILKQPGLVALGQRQLDWVLGSNPFGECHVIRIGHVNPPEYIYVGFQPRVPFLTGATMHGIGGDLADRPDARLGYHSKGEFCISRTAGVIWLMAELQAANASIR